jgi:hypothetical protein
MGGIAFEPSLYESGGSAGRRERARSAAWEGGSAGGKGCNLQEPPAGWVGGADPEIRA